MYDYIIVGAGFAGAILARELAEKLDKRILVLDRRDHIGGNMFDFYTKSGILVQKYGPHSFHTNDENIYNYLCQYTEMIPYRLTYRAKLKGINIPCPFNFQSIDQLYNLEMAAELKNRLRNRFPNLQKVAIFELLESDDQMIKEYAQMLFEEDFRPYTAKQWGKEPHEIDQSVIRRVPILLNYRDSYFDDKFEALPKDGFSNLFRNILNHKNITINLGVNAMDKISFDGNSIIYDGNSKVKVIFTGAIDELFGYRFGRLPYRSLFFDFKELNIESYQETAIVAYPKHEGYTRITEFTKLPIQKDRGSTVIAIEYPLEYNQNSDKGREPYYPILNKDNVELYEKYKELSYNYRNLILCGRLADYKYYNMEDIIRKSIEIAKKIKDGELNHGK